MISSTEKILDICRFSLVFSGSANNIPPQFLHHPQFLLDLLTGSQFELYNDVVGFVLQSVVCQLLSFYLPAQLLDSLF